jgi:hypothetical protein
MEDYVCQAIDAEIRELEHKAKLRKYREARSKADVENLRSAWDPSKHPRGGNPKNTGQFSKVPDASLGSVNESPKRDRYANALVMAHLSPTTPDSDGHVGGDNHTPEDLGDPSGRFDKKLFWENVEAIAAFNKDAKTALDWFRRYNGQMIYEYRGWWSPLTFFKFKSIGGLEDGVPVIRLHSGFNEAEAAQAFYDVLTNSWFYGFKNDINAEKIVLPGYDNVEQAQAYWQGLLKQYAGITAAGADALLSVYSIGNKGVDWVISAKETLNGNYLAAIGFLPIVSGGTIKILQKIGAAERVLELTEREARFVRSAIVAFKNSRVYGAITRFRERLVVQRTDLWNNPRNVWLIRNRYSPQINGQTVHLHHIGRENEGFLIEVLGRQNQFPRNRGGPCILPARERSSMTGRGFRRTGFKGWRTQSTAA